MNLPLGKYRHYKGHEYKVIGVGRHRETLEELVVYQALYESPEFEPGQIWLRPLAMFLETVVVDGIERPRFEYIGT